HNTGQFFFSSRRRHTRFSRDWSSDVCSSDLSSSGGSSCPGLGVWFPGSGSPPQPTSAASTAPSSTPVQRLIRRSFRSVQVLVCRSEERRVGKECSCRWRRDVRREKRTSRTER